MTFTKTLAMCATAAAMTFAGTANAAIIISQYYEGASFDKYIELYNTGNSTVDLAAGNYQLSLWSNTNRENWKSDGVPTQTVALTGSIAAGGTYIIEHGSAANPGYVVADQVSSGVINFNGDDSVGLWTGTTFSTASIVDVLGLTGNTGADTSFVRNNTVTTGTNTDFNAGNWTVFSNAAVGSAASNSNEYLGFHSLIPEPGSVALLGLGALAILRRRSA